MKQPEVAARVGQLMSHMEEVNVMLTTRLWTSLQCIAVQRSVFVSIQCSLIQCSVVEYSAVQVGGSGEVGNMWRCTAARALVRGIQQSPYTEEDVLQAIGNTLYCAAEYAGTLKCTSGTL